MFFFVRSICKPWSLIPFACNTTKCMDTDNLRTKATDDSEYHPTVDHIYFTSVIQNSSHRDGAIYKNEFIQKDFLEGDIADRNESKSVCGPNDQISFASFYGFLNEYLLAIIY